MNERLRSPSAAESRSERLPIQRDGLGFEAEEVVYGGPLVQSVGVTVWPLGDKGVHLREGSIRLTIVSQLPKPGYALFPVVPHVYRMPGTDSRDCPPRY